MNIGQYLDSTYLKTPAQSGLTEEETLQAIKNLTQEAINNQLFAVMIRPDYVGIIRDFIDQQSAPVVLGTVIGFHEGTALIEDKLKEAQLAINDGVDELDFVINYQAYKNGNLNLVKTEFINCTKLALDNKKVAKWIIEIAALTDSQIVEVTANIWAWAQENFDSEDYPNIFVKSSTGFYPTENGKPNGATKEAIRLMLDNAGQLPVKAAGGVRTPTEAKEMIEMGVKRIGTSSALALIKGLETGSGY